MRKQNMQALRALNVRICSHTSQVFREVQVLQQGFPSPPLILVLSGNSPSTHKDTPARARNSPPSAVGCTAHEALGSLPPSLAWRRSCLVVVSGPLASALCFRCVSSCSPLVPTAQPFQGYARLLSLPEFLCLELSISLTKLGHSYRFLWTQPRQPFLPATFHIPPRCYTVVAKTSCLPPPA